MQLAKSSSDRRGPIAKGATTMTKLDRGHGSRALSGAVTVFALTLVWHAAAVGSNSGPGGPNAISRDGVALISTGIDADARGRARLVVRGSSDARFEVTVKRLDRRASFEVLI